MTLNKFGRSHSGVEFHANRICRSRAAQKIIRFFTPLAAFRPDCRVTMEEFSRIKRLPPYVFNITGELKAAARKRARRDHLSIGQSRSAHAGHMSTN